MMSEKHDNDFDTMGYYEIWQRSCDDEYRKAFTDWVGSLTPDERERLGGSGSNRLPKLPGDTQLLKIAVFDSGAGRRWMPFRPSEALEPLILRNRVAGLVRVERPAGRSPTITLL